MPLSTHILFRLTIADLTIAKGLLISAEHPPLVVIKEVKLAGDLFSFCTINQKGLYITMTTNFHILGLTDIQYQAQCLTSAFTLRRCFRSAAFAVRRVVSSVYLKLLILQTPPNNPLSLSARGCLMIYLA